MKKRLTIILGLCCLWVSGGANALIIQQQLPGTSGTLSTQQSGSFASNNFSFADDFTLTGVEWWGFQTPQLALPPMPGGGMPMPPGLPPMPPPSSSPSPGSEPLLVQITSVGSTLFSESWAVSGGGTGTGSIVSPGGHEIFNYALNTSVSLLGGQTYNLKIFENTPVGSTGADWYWSNSGGGHAFRLTGNPAVAAPPVPVPEPTTLLLFALGLVLITLAHRVRKRA